MSYISDAIRIAAGDDETPAQDQLAEETLAAVKGPRFKLLDIDDLADLPEPEWLVEGMLPALAVATLYGPSGCGKSFLALDFALCVASGTQWNGKLVKQGRVIYIVGEGLDGFHQRVEAWILAHPEVDKKSLRRNFHVIPKAVKFFDEDHRIGIVNTVKDLGDVALVVVDTVDRAFAGLANENNAQDMSRYVALCDEIKYAGQTTVLSVHHTAKDGKVERGGNGLRGASETMLHLKPEQGGVVLYCDKQKNAAEFKGVGLSLQPTGRSVVLIPSFAPTVSSARNTFGIREEKPAFSGGGARGGGFF